jgi:CheY-like chemotaxis protein
MLRDGGFEVRHATTAVDALDLVRGGRRIDLLLAATRIEGQPSGFVLARMARLRRPDLAVAYFGEARDIPEREAERALALLSAALPQQPEPWVNVVAWREADAGFTLLLYPRTKHRPEAFHRGERIVSPAAIDLAGLVVTPVEKDFDRLTGPELRTLFEEVSIGEAELAAVVAGLGGAR